MADISEALRRFVSHHEHSLYGFLKVMTANIVQDYFADIVLKNAAADSPVLGSEACNPNKRQKLTGNK